MSYNSYMFWQFLDSSGTPIPGAIAKFFEAGTSTPLDVFSDRARTVSLGAEVTADGDGKIGPIYLDESKAYKYVLRNAADTATLETVDDIVAQGGGGSGPNISSRATSPLDYGAIGDGVSDESAAVQSAIDDATGDIDLAGKMYRCDAEIVLKSGIRMYSGLLDFSQHTGPRCISAIGSLGVQLILIASAEIGDTSIELSLADAATLAPGDWLLLDSSSTIDGSKEVCEWVRIVSISGTTVNLSSALLNAHDTTDGAKVKKLLPVENVALQDVRVMGVPQASIQNAIHCEFANKIRCERVYIDGIDGQHFGLITTINSSIVDCASNGTHTVNSIGVGANNGCQNIGIRNFEAEGMAYGVHIGNGVRTDQYIRMDGGGIYGSSIAAVLSEVGARHVIVDDVGPILGRASSIGFVISGGDVTVSNCHIRDVHDAFQLRNKRTAAFSSSGSYDPPNKKIAFEVQITGCNVELCSSHGVDIVTEAGAVPYVGVRVADCTFNGFTDEVVFVNVAGSTSNIEHMLFENNIINGCDNEAIAISCANGQTIKGLVISDNSISNVAASANCIDIATFNLSAVENCIIANNSIQGGKTGIFCDDINGLSIRGCSIRDTASHGIHAQAQAGLGGPASYIHISGHQIISAGGDGVFVHANGASLKDVMIGDVQVNTPAANGVRVKSETGDSIRFAAQKLMVTAPGANSSGFLADSASPGGIVGNVSDSILDDGNFGIWMSKCDHVRISHVQCRNQLDGVSPAKGVYITNCNDVTLSDVNIDNCQSDGIEIAADVTPQGSIRVFGGSVVDAGDSGILVNVNDVIMGRLTISGMQFDDCVKNAIEVLVTAIGSSAALTDFVVDGVVINHSSGAHGIDLRSDAAGSVANIERFSIREVYFRNSGSGNAIRLRGDGDLQNGSLHACEAHGGDYFAEIDVTGIFANIFSAAHLLHNQNTGIHLETNGTFAYKATGTAATGVQETIFVI